jgi:hypothetical protein
MADLKDLVRDLKKVRNNLVRGANDALEKTAKEAISMAKLKSSGTYSYDDLADMGHPYSESKGLVKIVQHHGRSKKVTFKRISPKASFYPYGDRRVINKQSGEFYNSWLKYQDGTTSTGINLIGIHNTAPHASALEYGIAGLTISREIDQHIRKRIEEVLPVFVQAALDKAFDPIIKR